MRAKILLITFLVNASLIGISYYWLPALWLFIIVGPLSILAIVDVFQTRHTIKRNFPIVGMLRYIMEDLRPKIYQYFVESNTNGTPVNRMFRTIVYQRAKKVLDTSPFGTQMEVYKEGHEYLEHSIEPRDFSTLDQDPRVLIGGERCKKPYNASILNVSAMSFGALSQHAVMALNKGAKKGGFAHNTGEGGLSEYHLKHGGDLIWQIGTGYFGCRTPQGTFDPAVFADKAKLDSVKMIEIKISQGAKPSHGGILPAVKNTKEIAHIRGVQPHTDVISPPYHTAFKGPKGLLQFTEQLRELSGGKPVGFKLCIGKKEDFIAICEAMVETGMRPDFITIDGSEGGTGAAPLEFSNSVGMPFRDALAFAHDTLTGYNLRKDLKLIGSGKIITGFHMIRAFALGADACNSARAMMFALGCIMALECNNNKCPTGIATQKKHLYKGLDVDDKARRVANYHHETVHSVVELVASTGVEDIHQIKRKDINRRIDMHNILDYEQIYPSIKEGALLNGEIPDAFKEFYPSAQ